MAFKRFGFTKLWTDPAAFPTVETDEVQVRADMQVLHDESKNGLNGLMAEMEAKTASASLGAKAPDGSTASNVQKELDDLNAAKHTHSNKALLDTYTQTEANLKSAVTNKHTHSNKTILDAVTASFTTALATAYNRLVTLFSGITSVATTLGTDNTSIPTSKAVSDALAASGSLPTGGATNQVLSKTSAGNYATAWKTITPAGIGAATAAEVAELKTSVSEGKALVAAAVTDMGVETAADASFQVMAEHVLAISTGYNAISGYSSSVGGGISLSGTSCTMNGNRITFSGTVSAGSERQSMRLYIDLEDVRE